MSNSELATAPVNPGFHKATSALANVLGIEPRMMIDTIKRQCFLGMNADNISDTQLAALVSVAQATGLNPLVPGMLFAYPSRNGGIVPMTGPDGVFKILDEAIMNGKLTGFECTVFPEDVIEKPTHATATIWRKDNEHPSKYTAIFSEWSVGNNPNWGSRPRHMIWLRAIKQCARQVIHGIPYDDDEAEIGNLKNVTQVTPGSEQQQPPPVTRADPKPRRGAAAAKEAAKEVVVEQEPAKTEQSPAQDPKNVTPEPEKLKADPAPAKTPDIAAAVIGNKPTPRAFLKDGEIVECVVEVISSEARNAPGPDGKAIPSAMGVVKGDYCGAVRHLGGGKIVDGKTVVQEMWTPGRKLNVKLRGKLSDAKEGTPNYGKTLVWADSVEEVAQEF